MARWGGGALILAAGLGLVLIWATGIGFSADPSGTSPRWSSAQVARCIRDPACHRTFVAAHRAGGYGGLENSRAAVVKALEAGVPIIEIDLRSSRDGQLFAMHDGKLEHYTRLLGRVEEASSEEIAGARLRNGETVARFEDLYAITRGRAVLSVDFKAPEAQIGRVAEWIAANGSFDDLIFFANTGEEMMVAARAKTRHPQMIVMVRLLDTRVTVDSTRAMFGGRLPDILHTERLSAGEVAAVQALGVKVYVSALPLDGYLPPFRYFAMRSLLRTGVDFVLTDEPETVMRRLATVRRP